MQRPSPQEVAEYAKSIGFNLDGEYFCDYQEAKGWMYGGSPIKNWKCVVRNWKRRPQFHFQPQQGGTAPTKPYKSAPTAVSDMRTLAQDRKETEEREAEFNRDWEAIRRLPTAQYEAIYVQALTRLPSGRLAQTFKETLIPPLMVEVWREQSNG